MLTPQNSIYGGNGNDSINAFGNLLTIDAGAGNDIVGTNYATVTLGAGSDIFKINRFGSAVITDFVVGEDSLNLELLRADNGNLYNGIPGGGWSGDTNPFAIIPGFELGYVRIIQDLVTPADTLVQVLQDIPGQNGQNPTYEFQTVARLVGVSAAALTNDSFNPPWDPTGVGTAPNYTPHANPDIAPFGGTDSIQFAAFTQEAGIEMWRLGSRRQPDADFQHSP